MRAKDHYKKELTIPSAEYDTVRTAENCISYGDKGLSVKRLQEHLELARLTNPQLLLPRIAIDGDYGPATRRALRTWKNKVMHMHRTGDTVDQKVWERLVQPLRRAFTEVVFDDNTPFHTKVVLVALHHCTQLPREISPNSGPWVRSYMDGNEGKEWAWCAGFVQSVLYQALQPNFDKYSSIMPHTYSCDIILQHAKNHSAYIAPDNVESFSIESGDLFLVINPKNDKDATHVGIVEYVYDNIISTIEGNTNDEGSREGFEVCRRERSYDNKRIGIVKLNQLYSSIIAEVNNSDIV